MKINFLGTCHGAQEKNRFFTCMLIEVGDAMYLIDAGAPFLYLMKNMDKDINKLKACFITHMHGDHALEAYRYATACPGRLFLPEEEDIKQMENLIWFMHCEWHYMHRSTCKINCVTDESLGAFYDDGIIKVTAIPTHHLARGKSFAYLVEAEGKKVLFTGDLAGDFSDYPVITEKEDLEAVICELTHFEVETAIPKFNKTRAKRIIFNHVREDKVALITEHKDEVEIDYYIANDGDVIEI